MSKFIRLIVILIISIISPFFIKVPTAFAQTNLKVLTFNLVGTVGTTEQNEINVLNHVSDIVELIIDSKADIVGLQEVRTRLDPNDPDDILMLILAGLKAKGYNYNLQHARHFSFAVLGKDWNAGVAVLSKYPIEETTTVSTVSERKFLVFKITIPEGYIRIVNVHPSVENACWPKDNHHFLIRKYVKTTYPNDALIIMGDFNARPTESCVEKYFQSEQDGGLNLAEGCDANINSECKNTMNFATFGGPENESWQIDQILYSKNAVTKSLSSNFNVRSSKVYNSDSPYTSAVTGAQYNTNFSDHYPVLVEFDFNDLTPLFRAQAIQYYKEFLGRSEAYESDGVKWHANNIKTNGCKADILNFAQSTAFINRKNSFSDIQYIRMLYRGILSREPELGGLNWFTNQLYNGQTKDWVLNALVNSNEAKNVCDNKKLINPLDKDFNNDGIVNSKDLKIVADNLFHNVNTVNTTNIPTQFIFWMVDEGL